MVTQSRQEYLSEFQAIVEMESIATTRAATE